MRYFVSVAVLCFVLGVLLMDSAQAKSPKALLTFVGTYTGEGKGKGIYSFKLSLADGKLAPLAVTEGISNPSFLAIHPNGEYLYAVSEVAETDGKPGGSVWAYKIDRKSGKLKEINHQSSAGAGPCYVSIDKKGSCALVANYDSGSVASLAINSDGSLAAPVTVIQHEGSSVDPARQKGPHAHSINVTPDNNYVLAADLGLDKVLIYKLDSQKAQLLKNEPAFCTTPAGGGPRHLAFSPNAKHAYVSNEMTSAVSVYAYDSHRGALEEIQTINTLPSEVKDNSAAEIQIHPSGKFAYCSNRGHDSLAIFSIDENTGKLKAIGHQNTLGQKPRNFTIDPTGLYITVCNQDSNNIIVFKINLQTGLLTQVGKPINVPSPVCVKFLAEN